MSSKKKKSVGRPPLAAELRGDHRKTARLRPSQLELLARLCEALDASEATVMRRALELLAKKHGIP